MDGDGAGVSMNEGSNLENVVPLSIIHNGWPVRYDSPTQADMGE